MAFSVPGRRDLPIERSIVDATQGDTSWERVGELAAQLSACAADLERFLLDETQRLQALESRFGQPSGGGQPMASPRRIHPGSNDPVIAAVLEQFQRLEAASRQEDAV
jgi:hypothetical protein